MQGKTVLITGGNAGIGRQTAIGLAKKGAAIIIACRNTEKGQAAVAAIKAASNNEQISMLPCDLASFASIRKCAGLFKATHDKLDVLINNAGIFTSEKKKTEDGYELQFGVNHLGPFLLTQLLLESLEKAPNPRIINLSSKAHFRGAIDFDNLQGEKKGYSAIQAYGQSKLANVLFTRELARRYPHIISHSLHPGVVSTAIGTKDTKWYLTLLWKLGKPFMITPEKGAATSIYLASSPEVTSTNGQYFDNKKQYKPSKLGRDEGLARMLWKVSEEAVKR